MIANEGAVWNRRSKQARAGRRKEGREHGEEEGTKICIAKGQTHRNEGLKNAVEEKVPHHLTLRDVGHQPYHEVGDDTKGSGKDNPVGGIKSNERVNILGCLEKRRRKAGLSCHTILTCIKLI